MSTAVCGCDCYVLINADVVVVCLTNDMIYLNACVVHPPLLLAVKRETVCKHATWGSSLIATGR